MKAFEEDEALPPPLPDAIDPWDLVVDDGATRVLATLDCFKDRKLRERLRALAIGAMMASTARRRSQALRRLSDILMIRDVRHLADARLLGMLSEGEPPEDLTAWLH